MADSTFMLLDPETDFSVEFQFFPESIRTTGRANWDAQNTTLGKKPLFYANSEPLVITIDEAHWDQTHTNVSVATDIDLLRYLHSELEEGGPPPALLAIWGQRRIRCVLTDLTIEESMFTGAGEPLRLRGSLELVELQEEGETTNVQVLDDGAYNGPPFI